MREASGASAALTGLPGGAGISPLGDRFQPDLVRGSGSFSMPLSLPVGPGGLMPKLNLDYGSGNGNGPFGLGWRLDLPRIERQSDRGIPRYDETDKFVLGGAELLVDVGSGRFRPRVDNQSWLIERYVEGWRIKTGTGSTLYLGSSAASREGADRVFAWHIEREVDPAGNEIRFRYEPGANRLLVAAISWSVFALEFDYEERPDIVRNGRAGFLRSLERRVKALRLTSAHAQRVELRRYNFDYTIGANGISLLSKIALIAEQDGDAVGLPPLSFDYSKQDLSAWEWHTLTAELAPPSLDLPETQLIDMSGDGLPDLLHDNGNAMRLWRNAGQGRFEGPVTLPAVPGAVRLAKSNVGFADLNGNGRADLFVADEPLQMAMQNDGHGGFEDLPLFFGDAPHLALASPSTRLTDIDGDGVTDILETARDHFVVHCHEPGKGWSEALLIERRSDLEYFPDISFGERGVRLADMTGDGLQDLVLVRSGDACYWPSLGNGRFGSRVSLADPPRLPGRYREDRLLVVDLDGDGCADLLYCGDGETIIWRNLAGTGFGPAERLPVVIARGGAQILPVDIFGDGVTSLVWAEASSKADAAGCAALRFDGGARSNLLVAIDNGMGGETRIEYQSTTAMRLDDIAKGRPWLGSLPVSVPVVCSIVETDTIGGAVRRSSMRYRDGVFDGIEREFRGFTEVDQWLEGDELTPTIRQHYRYFQGEPELPDRLERSRQRALSGSLVEMMLYEVKDGTDEPRLVSRHSWETALLCEAGEGVVHSARLVGIEQREFGRESPDRVDRTDFSGYDAFGNVGRSLRVLSYDGEPRSAIVVDKRLTHVTPDDNWLCKLVAREELWSGSGVERVRDTYYDGEPFAGLPFGQAKQGFVSRVRDLKLADARIPSGYFADHDPEAMGFVRASDGAPPGWYADTHSVGRDRHGNATEERDALGRARLTEFDPDGLYPIHQTDAVGHATLLVIDPETGMPESHLAADGRLTRFVYDALGRPKAQYERDDMGDEQLVACWAQDMERLPVSTTAWFPQRAGLSRDEAQDAASAGQIRRSRIYYNGFGERIQTIETGPSATDGAMRLVARGAKRLNVRGNAAIIYRDRFVDTMSYAPPTEQDIAERLFYDANGHVTERVGEGEARFRIERDTETSVHFEAGRTSAVRTETFDPAGRIVRIDQHDFSGADIRTQYALTADGRIATASDGSGTTYLSYDYGAEADALRITSADAGARDYIRDAAGQLITLKLADGERIDYRYDLAGRPLAAMHRGKVLRSYEYGPLAGETDDFTVGRLKALVEPDTRIDYAYTRAGRTRRERLTVAGASFETRWDFGFGGDVERIAYPDGGIISHALDAAGHVTAIDGLVQCVDYDASGAVLGYAYANGARVAVERTFGAVTAFEVRHRETLLRRVEYSRNEIGGCTGLRDMAPASGVTRKFAFDGLHRLIEATAERSATSGGSVATAHYAYDALGNIRAFGQTGANFFYDDVDRPSRLTSVRTTTETRQLAYNARGHVVDLGDGTAISYDMFDRMTGLARRSGAQTEFVLDPLGRVARRTIAVEGIGAAPQTVHTAGAIFEQHDEGARRHVFLNGTLVATIETRDGVADRNRYSVADHQGSIFVEIDEAGAPLAQQQYSPFGSAEVSGLPLDRYLGIERDPAFSIQRVGARPYSASLGRFLSPDWYILENPERSASLPQGFNCYSYSVNNPVDFKDPSGRWFFLLAALGFVVGTSSGAAQGLSFGDSLLKGLETGLTTAVGAALGSLTSSISAFAFPLPGAQAGLGGLMGGINGLFTGVRGIYHWGDGSGFLAFLSDSTWGLFGTSLGNVLNIVNVARDAEYLPGLSQRQNRQVYNKGSVFKESSSFTEGNVISNINGRFGPHSNKLIDHETFHIIQNRIFGAIFVDSYLLWLGIGAIISGPVALAQDRSYDKVLYENVYLNEPWERWAYEFGGSH